MSDTLHAQIVERTGLDSKILLAVFRPDGRLEHSWIHGEKWMVTPVLNRLRHIASLRGVAAGPPLFPAITTASRRRRPDDLVLEATCRFLVTEEQAQAIDPVLRAEVPPGPDPPPPPGLVLHRVKAPSQDWHVIPRERWSALLAPPKGSSSASWEVQGEPALSVVRALIPPNELFLVGDDRILEHTLRVTRVARYGQRETLRLTGRVLRNHPLWAKRDDELAEARFCGYLEVDQEAGAILSFHLATQGGRYRGRTTHPSLDLPWGVAIRGHVPPPGASSSSAPRVPAPGPAQATPSSKRPASSILSP